MPFSSARCSARHFITETPAAGQHAHASYLAQARQLLEQLRQRTSAPILIDNLPEPTVQPLGLAERGITGHRTRFRLANVALAELAEDMPGVHVVDIAAALGAAGSERMLDDGQVAFTHFGSPGWMLQRPESEKAAVHGIFPDTARRSRNGWAAILISAKARWRARISMLSRPCSASTARNA
jgi:hypothetical protein